MKVLLETPIFSVRFCALLFFHVLVVGSVGNLQLSQLSQWTANKQVCHLQRRIFVFRQVDLYSNDLCFDGFNLHFSFLLSTGNRNRKFGATTAVWP